MIVAPYDSKRGFDIVTAFCINEIKKKMIAGEDDGIIIAVGPTGVGKSMLMLHIMQQYLGEEASIDYIGLSRSSFADAIPKVIKKQGLRFLGYDEANISKRDSMTKWNKEIYDWYMMNRGLQIFHWWSNPSLDMIDKAFIEERIKGFILITTKDVDRPRIFYYFTKEKLLNIFEKYQSLKLKILKKVRKKYAHHRGWFKDFPPCKLKSDYMDVKSGRMMDRSLEFAKRWGSTEADKMLSRNEIAKKIGIAAITLAKYEKDYPEVFQDMKYESPTGRKFFKPEVIDKILEVVKRNKEIQYVALHGKRENELEEHS